jgi:hypothetical protein
MFYGYFFKKTLIISRYFLKVSIFFCVLTLVAVIFNNISFATDNKQQDVYYVSPAGTDFNNGKSLNTPFKTIQKAIDMAGPGSVINLSSGEYNEDLVSRQNGEISNPITIVGPKDAILKGDGNHRMIEINHDYHILDGFTVDGLHGSAEKESGYRDILIYILGKKKQQGPKGIKIINMTLKNAGGECIRLRYFVTESEISYNTISNCGVYDFVFDDGGKNGEGIYIGTSSKQWKDGKNPTSDPDETKNNIIHHNYIDTQGNECVDIKEGATNNIVEYNTCRGQKDVESGGLDSRGSNNIFRYNDVRGSFGAGIRLGGWKVNGIQYGQNNDVYENTIIDNKNGGIKFQVSTQGKICGNILENNKKGDSVGSFGSDFTPSLACEKTVEPSESIVEEEAVSKAEEAETDEVKEEIEPSKVEEVKEEVESQTKADQPLAETEKVKKKSTKDEPVFSGEEEVESQTKDDQPLAETEEVKKESTKDEAVFGGKEEEILNKEVIQEPNNKNLFLKVLTTLQNFFIRLWNSLF